VKDENGKKIGTKGFQDHYKTDFTYDQATYEPGKRGCAQHWVMECDTSVCDDSVKNVMVDLTECRRGEVTRLQKTVFCELADKIERLLEDIPKNDKKSLALVLWGAYALARANRQ